MCPTCHLVPPEQLKPACGPPRTCSALHWSCCFLVDLQAVRCLCRRCEAAAPPACRWCRCGAAAVGCGPAGLSLRLAVRCCRRARGATEGSAAAGGASPLLCRSWRAPIAVPCSAAVGGTVGCVAAPPASTSSLLVGCAACAVAGGAPVPLLAGSLLQTVHCC